MYVPYDSLQFGTFLLKYGQVYSIVDKITSTDGITRKHTKMYGIVQKTIKTYVYICQNSTLRYEYAK